MKLIGEIRDWRLVLVSSVLLVVSWACGVKGPPVAPEDLLLDTSSTLIEDEEGQESTGY